MVRSERKRTCVMHTCKGIPDGLCEQPHDAGEQGADEPVVRSGAGQRRNA